MASKTIDLSKIQEMEKTPLVQILLEILADQEEKIQFLKDEVSRLKGNPVRPTLKPSKTSEIDKTEKRRSSKKKALGRRKRKI